MAVCSAKAAICFRDSLKSKALSTPKVKTGIQTSAGW